MDEVISRVSVTFCVVVGALALASAQRSTGTSDLLSPDLIVVQVPASATPPVWVRDHLTTPLDRYVDGARIVRIGPSGSPRAVLTPEFTGACDPDVSFDGKTIVFAGKRDPGDSWQIWRMNADGSGKVQLTRGPGSHVAPVFAGTRFYLDDPQPTPQVIFAADDHDSGVFSLYATDTAGASLHRITFNLRSDFSPAVLPTGQIVFTSWQRGGESWEPEGHFALMSVNIDGTDLMPFHGNQNPPLYRDMAAVDASGDRVYFVESERLSWLGGGRLAYVSWRRPLGPGGRLGGESPDSGVFHSPTPLPDGGLLASYRGPDPMSTFSVYRVDPLSGKVGEKLFGEGGWHSIDPHPLAPRPPVKGRSNWLRPGSTTGVFYCLDAYLTGPGVGENGSVAPRGTLRYVRVIEGSPRRILGIAPVEEDGSFHIRVPAETPLTFQLLDEDYMAVRSQRTWTWVMGNENRGCIGCHEDPELSPPNRMKMAIPKAPVDLAVPPDRRRTVDFLHQIGPSLASSCATAGCHVEGGAQPVLGGPESPLPEPRLREIYEALLQPREGSAREPWVVPGRARSSALVHLLLDEKATTRSGAAHAAVDRTQKLTFIEWVDLGAMWSTTDSVAPEAGASPARPVDRGVAGTSSPRIGGGAE